MALSLGAVLIFCCACSVGTRQGAEAEANDKLLAELEAYVADKDARIGVAVIVDGRDTLAVNGDMDFPMMSVFKFPLALSVAEWVDLNGFSLGDSIAFGPNALREDTYSPMLKKYGRKPMVMSYKELMEWALIESDNNAADILLKRVGGTGGAMNLLQAVGAPSKIRIGASEEDMHRDLSLCYKNLSTPLAMAALFDRFDLELRDRSASYGEIALMLERCRTGLDRLSAPLDSTNTLIGHKTGTGDLGPDGLIMAVNDCGYIHLPATNPAANHPATNHPASRRYSIAVFVADSHYDLPATSRLIADLSAIVLRHLSR